MVGGGHIFQIDRFHRNDPSANHYLPHTHSTSMHAHEYLDGRRQLALPVRRRVVARPVTPPAPTPTPCPPPPTTMSIRGDEMADEVEEGVRVDLSCRSNECSCSMKWKLGDTSCLRARTNEKASLRQSDLVCMR